MKSKKIVGYCLTLLGFSMILLALPATILLSSPSVLFLSIILSMIEIIGGIYSIAFGYKFISGMGLWPFVV